MIHKTILILLTISGIVFGASPSEWIVSIRNPKTIPTDSLIIDLSDRANPKLTRRLSWFPHEKLGGDPDGKDSVLTWYQAAPIPEANAFLLIRHKMEYESDIIFPEIIRIDKSSVSLATAGIGSIHGPDGYGIFISTKNNVISFIPTEPPHDSYGEEYWAKHHYRIDDGKPIPNWGNQSFGSVGYVRISIPEPVR